MLRAGKEFLELVRAASRLDLYDLNYEYSSERLNILGLAENNLPRKGVLVRMAAFARQYWRSALQAHGKGRIPEGAILFYARFPNELDSVRPIYSGMEGAHPIGYGSTASNNLTAFKAYTLALPFLPLVALRMLRASGYQRRSFHYSFDHYWAAYGVYLAARMWMRRWRPSALVVSNNVNSAHRTLCKAAREEGIPTCYVPHASAPRNFPPLDYTVSLLEGEYAVERYREAGPANGRVYMVGIPKHDEYVARVNRSARLRALGICINSLDPEKRVIELCREVRGRFPDLEIVLRPHLWVRRVATWRELARELRMGYSTVEEQNAYDFLQRVDAIVAGESNIVLEAALMNVVPLYYDFAELRLDWYGFVRCGMVQYRKVARELCDELAKAMEAKPDVRYKARPYCATIGTIYDGRSSELARQVIAEMARGNAMTDGCRRLPGSAMELYEFVEAKSATL